MMNHICHLLLANNSIDRIQLSFNSSRLLVMSLVVLHAMFFMFGMFWAHVWIWCASLNIEYLYVSLRVKLVLAPITD
jgi:hypothetical protein